ncbi:pentapeptide repeat-containing protein [Nostoc sp. ChiQUE01b]|uniref:pentapeptide repeat-containing protein n=1 Tax=Nostoc sp. ChiQUE01b TaxID=3075376 RepID=UPI002AD1D729|nr:pentapeptide repeat-containing protein [Nostoc sp. ChiQUE01b]MDZ8264406.1 pentapeptide repeat-containing protein [Nostoc sp. ChiQUE01b]
MADKEHLNLLIQSSEVWNDWRQKNTEVQPNFSEANLERAVLINRNLQGANFKGANLHGVNIQKSDLSNADFIKANLSKANLIQVNLCGANLSEADIYAANLSQADLSGANLNKVNLAGAHLYKTNFNGANLSQADLTITRLIETNFERANITDCLVYGISAWGVKLDGANQSNLVITPQGESTITVDNLKVAQFIYLLINNKEIRDVIDTVAKKAVLILGRFTPEQLEVLQAIRNKLRELGYVPILFDFTKPESHDFIETVSTLAHISKFVIADFTDSRIVLEEVPHIARNVSVSIQPLFMKGRGNIAVSISNLRVNHRSILDDFYYENLEHLMQNFEQMVISPAEMMAQELLERKRKEAVRGQE